MYRILWRTGKPVRAGLICWGKVHTEAPMQPEGGSPQAGAAAPGQAISCPSSAFYEGRKKNGGGH